MRPFAIMLAVLAASCSKHQPSPPATTGSAGPAPAGDAAVAAAKADAAATGGSSVAATTGSGAGSGSAADRAPLTPAERAARATYRDAMKRGRIATDKPAYADAIAAFDAALVARPGEPHALAERGFAKLLAGTDLEAASADFDRAADATRDPKLLAMIWFNRGLADDKLGQPDAALVDYYLANQLRPSKAAAAKLAGKKVCPVRIASAKEIPSDPAVDAADWRALLKGLDQLDEDAGPKTSDDARALIFGADAKPTLPTGVVIGGSLGKVAVVVGDRGGGKLRAIAVASEVGGRCAGSVGVSIEGVQGTLIHVRATEQTGGGMTPMCHSGPADGGTVAECTGADGEEHQGNACDDTGTTVRDLVIDLATGKRVLVAEQPAPIAPGIDTSAGFKLDDARLVQAKLAADGLHLSGLGCDQVISIPTK